MSWFFELLGRLVFEAFIGGLVAIFSPKKRKERASAARHSASDEKHQGRKKPTPPSQKIHEVRRKDALHSTSYAPRNDGDADPGEVVWTWVPFEEDATQGKDRPVVVLGRSGKGVHVAQMTSKDHDRDAAQEARWGRYWLDIGTGDWDAQGRPSEVRLDRILWVPLSDIRREGGVVPQSTFNAIIEGIRSCPAD
ncbi:MAG: type II toxin-antitoxin system PemK/MazF family toxin [Actinomycetaceae bacterium]|nr:type II toxin-antitoxin system PemK/MazF family toxin [Actinomycetaceae bacterium]